MVPIIKKFCDEQAKDPEEYFKQSVAKKQEYHNTREWGPLVVALVGLPARGKTVTATKLARYLTWTGDLAQVFVVSEYRRKLVDRYDSHDLFRADNMEAREIRRKSCQAAMEDAARWLQAENGGVVAVLDGTNGTREQRQIVYDYFVGSLGIRTMFVEFVLEDEEILARNVKEVLKNSPDYHDMALEKARNDFQQKVQHYLEQYEPLNPRLDNQYSFMRILNEGENIVVSKLKGHLEAKIQMFLTNFSPAPKTFYLTRHGESENNVLGRIGGDANLSPRGRVYGASLAKHINSLNVPGLRVWTSELRRTKQTAQEIIAPKEHLPALNELYAGVCEGMTYEEMADKFPQEFAWRDQDKLRYRYPWGESYVDIMLRLEPVLLELEHENNIMIVSHQAVLRCILGYFLNKSPEELPYINVPLHTIIKLTTEGYSCRMEFLKLPVECVDTYRGQPEKVTPDRTVEEALVTVPAHFDSLKLWPLMQQN